MQSLLNFVNESLSTKQKKLVGKIFSNNDSNDYLAYEPNEDMFLKYEDNKERIISQIAEYINKYKI